MIRYFSRRWTSIVLAGAAAVAAVWSVFINWYAGREGSNIRLNDLFATTTTVGSATITSLFIPFALAALLVVIFAVVGWRWLLVAGAVLCVATVMIWGIRQAQTPAGLHAALVDVGPQLGAGAGLLMLIAAAVAPGRGHPGSPQMRAERGEAVPAGRGMGILGLGRRRTKTTPEDAYSAGYSDAREGQGADTRTRHLTGSRGSDADAGDARRGDASRGDQPGDQRRGDERPRGDDDPNR
jgi:hypothetical protein